MGFTLHNNHTHTVDPEYVSQVIMNKSNHSYVINQQITRLLNKDSWKGKSCFIIAGGSSLKNFDFAKLEGKLSIGINKAFLCFNPTINYSMDSDFYDGIWNTRYDQMEGCNVKNKWLNSSSIKIFLTPMEFKQFNKDVYLIRRVWRPSVNRDNLDNGIYGGRNSAVGAINLAIALGATQINLLGYDMQAVSQSHWHNGYPNRNIEEFNIKLQEYKQEIEQLAPLWNATGNVIMNLNTESALNCFTKGDLETILKSS